MNGESDLNRLSHNDTCGDRAQEKATTTMSGLFPGTGSFLQQLDSACDPACLFPFMWTR